MKLKQSDVDEIMKQLSGKIPNNYKEELKPLLDLIGKGHEANSLWPAIACDAIANCLIKGKGGIAEAVTQSAKAGVYVGITIGYYLGLREAGLELGIPSTSSIPTPAENNLEEKD